MGDLLTLVEARLHSAFGEPDARAAVTFLGAERIEVLRFSDGDLLRYATLGMSAQPMNDPLAAVADPVRGPRAELLLTVRGGLAETDRVLRPLAVLAATPQVEGVVVAPGNSLDVGDPLWPGAPFSAVLVAEGGGLVEVLG
ncbi:MAG TPA: suppressor of fused domain protein, partial [Streptomyces sp.]